MEKDVTERSFDALTRSLGRRRAVQAFGAAAAATLSSVTLIGAKSKNGNKNTKKQNKKIKKKALALCATQVTQCLALANDDPKTVTCCQELADCDFDGLITCLTTV
jgi:hypothetical protein